MIREVFSRLRISDYEIKINHRKVLSGIAEAINAAEKFTDLCVAIDKLDKIGVDKVISELEERGFSASTLGLLRPFLESEAKEMRDVVTDLISSTPSGPGGLADLRQVYAMLGPQGDNHVNFDPKLARGLSYYTGCIFEVKIGGVSVGSVSGGGRYDDLTGAFGLEGVSGVGFSFGIDRLYDAMEELNLFPDTATSFTTALFVAFDQKSWDYCLSFLPELRTAGVRSELYPSVAKPKKQFTYANRKGIPFVVIAGDEEMSKNAFSLKNMADGEQVTLTREEVLNRLIAYQRGQ